VCCVLETETKCVANIYLHLIVDAPNTKFSFAGPKKLMNSASLIVPASYHGFGIRYKRRVGDSESRNQNGIQTTEDASCTSSFPRLHGLYIELGPLQGGPLLKCIYASAHRDLKSVKIRVN